MVFEELDEVIIFGAGALLEKTVLYFQNRKIKIVSIADNNQSLHGTKIYGLSVVSPSSLEGCTTPIVIVSMFGRDISRQLKAINVQTIFDLSFIFDIPRWILHFRLDLIDYNIKKIKKVNDFLEDDLSKQVFNSLIYYRKTLDPSGIISADYPDYFHPIVHPINSDVIIDGGAWKGDSVVDFVNRLNNECIVYCFEPEEGNFKELVKLISEKEYSKTVYPENYGLWCEDKRLHFFQSAEFDMQFRIDPTDSSEVFINVVSLDNFIRKTVNKKVDFIKMDIEGAELSALLGAKELLENQKPRLAICIYHEYNDLWEIPLLIKKINPDYKIYMGHHSQNLFETVVYAI